MGPVNSGFKPKNTHLAGRFNLKKLHIFEKFLTFCKLNIIHLAAPCGTLPIGNSSFAARCTSSSNINLY